MTDDFLQASLRVIISVHRPDGKGSSTQVPIGQFLLVVLWNQASISNRFQDIQRRMWRNGWRNLKRPL